MPNARSGPPDGAPAILALGGILEHVVRLRCLALCIASMSAGCSFVLVQPHPARPGSKCTESVAAPVVDTALAVGALGATVVGGVMSANACHGADWPNCEDLAGFAILFGVAASVTAASAIVLGISASYGYVETAECRATMVATSTSGR